MNQVPDDTRPFPIQGGYLCHKPRGATRDAPSTVPWWLAQIAYDAYAKQYGTQQSLERLAERGGFGRAELLSLLRGES